MTSHIGHFAVISELHMSVSSPCADQFHRISRRFHQHTAPLVTRSAEAMGGAANDDISRLLAVIPAMTLRYIPREVTIAYVCAQHTSVAPPSLTDAASFSPRHRICLVC